MMILMSAKEEFPDSRIQDLVNGLFVPERSDACFEDLKLAGSRAVPFLVAAMRDPRVAATAYMPPYGLPDFSAPLFRVGSLLEESGSPEAAAPFLELLNHPEERLRNDGAIQLGSIALEVCIEPVNRLLGGADKDLRQHALMGIGHALKARRGAPAFFQAVRPALVNLLNVEDIFGLAPKLLAGIDALHATPILLEPDRLTLENPQFLGTLEALNLAHSTIPRDVLLRLMAELEPKVDNYFRARQLGEVLFAYARNPDAQTESKLRELAKSPVEQVQTGAARALAALHGLENMYKKLHKAVYGPGIKTMSAPEQHYWFAAVYHGEVQNGGPWQYFGNSTADHHRQILAGLRAIGASHSADMLEEAGKVFGPKGPPVDRSQRNDVMDTFGASEEQVVGELFSDYPTENIDALVDLYAVERKGEFGNCV